MIILHKFIVLQNKKNKKNDVNLKYKDSLHNYFTLNSLYYRIKITKKNKVSLKYKCVYLLMCHGDGRLST